MWQTQELVTAGMDDDTRHSLSEWESLTYDRTQWTLLVRQLEDLLVLQCLLKVRACSCCKVKVSPLFLQLYSLTCGTV